MFLLILSIYLFIHVCEPRHTAIDENRLEDRCPKPQTLNPKPLNHRMQALAQLMWPGSPIPRSYQVEAFRPVLHERLELRI